MTPTDVNDPASSCTNKNKKETPIGDFITINDFVKNGFQEIVEATKSVNAFPHGNARDLYCSYPAFGRVIDGVSDNILGLISKVLKWQNIKGNIQRRQQDEQFEMLLECNDAVLERLNSNLDEMAGIKKIPTTILIESRICAISSADTIGKGAGSWNLKNNDRNSYGPRLLTAKNIARSQLRFKTPVDNSAVVPFIPKLKDKPNSLKPLAILPEYDEVGNIVSYLHPYEFELMKFEVPESQIKRKIVKKPMEMNETQLMYVDTISKLKQAVEELSQHKEIAIDVEHHSYRSFLGFTCLVQISTRIKDYIFDAVELRDDMHILNTVLTNSKIVKIFHGADLDIEWLQRDLSLYVVNMFDTHQGAKALNFPRLSLAYLLKHYCDIEADKTFQLADWRIRPLPAELVAYARQDTHFLIYIFERITNDLLDASNHQSNLLRMIYQLSTEICKKRFAKPVWDPDSHMDLFRKSKRNFDNRQLFALREIYQWRDITARQEDESYGYVLPNHMMLQIAETLPREMQGVLACCNPIPPLVRQNLHIIHQSILRAREQPLVKPILDGSTTHRVNAHVKDYNSKLHCAHDLSHCEEFRDDLPTLINNNINQSPNKPKYGNITELCKPILNIFEKLAEHSDVSQVDSENLEKQSVLKEKMQFISPYQRYLAVLPLVEKEKRAEEARVEAENKKRKLCPSTQTPSIKREEEADIHTIKGEVQEDDLPIRDLLKRKYEESIAKKIKACNDVPNAKRAKTNTQGEENNSEICQSTKASGIDLSSDPSAEGPTTSQANSLPQKRNKFRNKLKPKKSHQSSDKPVENNFNYCKVNFKKFRGGAQRAKGIEMKPQFHGKSNANKTNNKKFNKLFTFSNVKSKDK